MPALQPAARKRDAGGEPLPPSANDTVHAIAQRLLREADPAKLGNEAKSKKPA